MNLLLTNVITKTIPFDNIQVVPVSRLIENLISVFGVEAEQAKDTIRHAAGSDFIDLREAFEIIRKTIGYKMVSERHEIDRTYYEFIKEN